MAGKRDKPEEIVLKLRQVEVLQGQGMAIADAVRQIGVTEPTYYRWRKQYRGMNRDQLKRLKELETENQRLRRAVSDLTLDKMILTEAARGNFIRPLSSDQWRKMVSSFAPSQVHRQCAAGARHIRAPRLPHTRAAPIDTPQGSMRRSGRGTADGRHHRVDARPRALRLSDDHRASEQRRLACEPQAGREDMAARRAKGPTETGQEGSAMAWRRVVRPAPAGAPEPRLVL